MPNSKFQIIFKIINSKLENITSSYTDFLLIGNWTLEIGNYQAKLG